MLPFFKIGEKVITFYGVCMVLGIGAAFWLSYVRLKKHHGDFNDLMIVFASALGGALLFAKLFYLFFSYGIVKAIDEILHGNLISLSSGGLVFYGGLIGGVGCAFLAIKLLHLDFNTYIQALMPAVPLGHGFGRIGCFMVGCCHGLPYEGAFAVHSWASGTDQTFFPIQAVEALLLFSLCLAMILLDRRFKLNGIKLLCIYGIGYPIIRFTLEFFRGDLIRGIYGGLSTSQWISIAIAVLCIALLVVSGVRKTAKKA